MGGGIAFCSILGSSIILNHYTHSVDYRFFNYFAVYYCGILAARFFKSRTLSILSFTQSLIILLPLWITGLVAVCLYGSRSLTQAIGWIGIFGLINISILLSERLKESVVFVRWVKAISYGSMCAYLFHREIYWLFLEIWKPENELFRLGFLFFIAFPVLLLLSYYIQQGYDYLYKRIASGKHIA